MATYSDDVKCFIVWETKTQTVKEQSMSDEFMGGIKIDREKIRNKGKANITMRK